ncbi:exo-alpha-sialidase [soil metagenome]
MSAAVLIGTTKGLFTLRGSPHAGGWEVTGPEWPGWSVDAVGAARREDGGVRMVAGGRTEHWGPTVLRSDDLGATWHEPRAAALAFPEDTDASLARIWQLLPTADGTVWAGVEPAALFVSTDSGETFSLVRGLWDHPHRPQWQPGGGGLCLHTIIPDPADPRRMWVAISTGGVYRTDDGGATWRARNAGIATPFLPGDEPPEFGQCVHKVALHPSSPDTLFLQHHWGVYRSDDAGDAWRSLGETLPSDFGFPVVVHPREPQTVYVLPLNSDEYRCTPDGRLRVYRSRDGGGEWEALTDGLPQQDAHATVLRDAFVADDADVPGLYFGTRAGDVYASGDGGDHWVEAARHLPPVLCVRAVAT